MAIVAPTVLEFDYGDQAKINVLFTDANGSTADPGTVTFKWLEPGGTINTEIYGGTPSSIIKNGVGDYYRLLNLQTVGTWSVRFEGTGPLTAAAESRLVVKKSAFY